jgi:ribosomal protein S18 acetylase RimI-like enzyme
VDVQIRRGTRADIPRLKPLWVAVHHVHAASMPELAPYVSDEETWAVRGALYIGLFERPDTVLMLAHVDGELAGYGLAWVMPVEDSWVPDTWATGPRIGEIESLSVLPAHRGAGIGSALMDALEAALREAGVEDFVVGALPGNEAVRLYERRGYKPTWLYLSRFAGR